MTVGDISSGGGGCGLIVLRPENGWRAFSSEPHRDMFLDVLIALGAEQVVKQISIFKDVAEARAALREEIGSATSDYPRSLRLSARA